MTPPARVAAAIEILDLILAGGPAEQVLTRWGRGNRYAGSGDRAAIRDHVYSALRNKRSFGYLGGSETGRGLMIGWSVSTGADQNILFTGDKYAPDRLSESEKETPDLENAPRAVRLDCPDWLLEKFEQTLGPDTDAVLRLSQSRAPVFLRVNSARATRDEAQAALATSDIACEPHKLADTALKVTTNPRRITNSPAYKDGMVELQDVASQAVVAFLPIEPGTQVLDYCAGGGGKSLAIAALSKATVTAFDALPNRMKDLPTRATRAGADIVIANQETLADMSFDLVLCDAPCSGSGSWRRSPDAKWTLTPDRLAELKELQASILDEASRFVTNTGTLAYVTCSLFDEENNDQIDIFLARNSDWTRLKHQSFSPLAGGDGFCVALLGRVTLE